MKLLAIDGNSIMNRAFYGIKALSNSKGMPTNALTGFLNIILKELQQIGPDCAAAAFDLKAPTFRHKKSPSYKANRKGMPPELAQQMPVIKSILTAMGIKVIECEGFEADDVLGTLSRIFSESGGECFIVTGDRDSLQLVSETTTVRLATNKGTVVYTPDTVNEIYGLEPKQLIEVKALMGDSSDNIPGVAGIGEKTALSLIRQFCDVDSLYEKLDDAQLTTSVRQKLVNGKGSAFESRWLGTIIKDAPISQSTDDYRIGNQNTEELLQILTDLEMFKMRERFSGSMKESSAAVEAEKKLSLRNAPVYEIRTLDNEAIAALAGKNFFIFDGQSLAVFSNDRIYLTQESGVVLKYLISPCEKMCFEAKQAHKLCIQNGKSAAGITFACDLAGYLLNSLSTEYTVENMCAKYKVMYRNDMGENADIASLPSLCQRLKAEIGSADMTKLYYEIELPLCEVLASMEVIGVKVDVDGVKGFGEDINVKISQLEQDIYAEAGRQFNIASPKQLGAVLFEDMGLPCKKKTKSGYSTNVEVLEAIEDKSPIIPMILEYRTLTKLSSTYVDGLLKQVHSDGRVHSVFRQTETRTGRISSTEPNVQNIPVRKDIGRNMRKFFIADNGKVLLDADYSQIELRVLAAVCGDENMRNVFLNGGDIHTSTAAQVFGLPEDFITPEMRRAAKAVNFGIIYGIGPFSLSKDIGVSVAQAKEYIQNYLDRFPKVSQFMNDVVDQGQKTGYVTTVFGRRRYIPELMSSNKNLQAFGKRAAMNAPIQGAAADIIKLAMVKVYRALRDEKLEAKLILQVHDELIIESSEKDAQRAAEILSREMNNAASLDVPIPADVNIGRSWYEAKD